MTFEIRKISNYGCSHPVVARLAMQTSELIQFSDLSKEDQGQVNELYFHTLKPRLLKCHEAHGRLVTARESTINEMKRSQSNPRVKEVPNIIGLKGEAETYLY